MIAVTRATAPQALVLAEVHRLAFSESWTAPEIAALMITPGARADLAVVDGDPAGFILTRAAGDEAEILTIATAPHLRRRGVADALIEAACAHLAATGVSKLFLEVAVDNASALALYAKHGFDLAGVRRGYYQRPDGARTDAQVLRRELNRPGRADYAGPPYGACLGPP